MTFLLDVVALVTCHTLSALYGAIFIPIYAKKIISSILNH
jgi:hypothetical protein